MNQETRQKLVRHLGNGQPARFEISEVERTRGMYNVVPGSDAVYGCRLVDIEVDESGGRYAITGQIYERYRLDGRPMTVGDLGGFAVGEESSPDFY